jgi:hypothetical protein
VNIAQDAVYRSETEAGAQIAKILAPAGLGETARTLHASHCAPQASLVCAGMLRCVRRHLEPQFTDKPVHTSSAATSKQCSAVVPGGRHNDPAEGTRAPRSTTQRRRLCIRNLDPHQLHRQFGRRHSRMCQCTAIKAARKSRYVLEVGGLAVCIRTDRGRRRPHRCSR